MPQDTGKIIAISVSAQKGEKKRNVPCAELKENYGIIGDAHAGEGDRQISLLAMESIERVKKKAGDVGPGDFAENITVQGMDLMILKKGDRLRLGPDVILEVTARGKACHSGCEIFKRIRDCIMPREGVFAKVIKGGTIKIADRVEQIDVVL